MTDKFLYLAGPIADCSMQEATYWRDYVRERLALNIVGVSPMREKGAEVAPDGKIPGNAKQFDKTLMSNERAIYTRDKYDCTNADGIFAYLPKLLNDRRPSIGTLIELGWANANSIPIVLVTDDDYYINHPILSRSVGWTVNDLDEGIEVANAIWGAYASRPVATQDIGALIAQEFENRDRSRRLVQNYAQPPQQAYPIQYNWNGVVGGVIGAAQGQAGNAGYQAPRYDLADLEAQVAAPIPVANPVRFG